MEEWKLNEVSLFRRAFQEADDSERRLYWEIEHRVFKEFFSLENPRTLGIDELRGLLHDRVQGIEVSAAETYVLSYERALSWCLIATNSQLGSDEWFRECIVSIDRNGKLCTRSSGVKALLWGHALGLLFVFWQEGVLHQLASGRNFDSLMNCCRGEESEETHATIRMLSVWPLVKRQISDFCKSEKELELLEFSGGRFIARLYFTHAISVEITRWNDSETIELDLTILNGSLVSWPLPMVRDMEFTRSIFGKWGVPCDIAVCEPDYFITSTWKEVLLSAAEAYLENFNLLFCGKNAHGAARVAMWRSLGESLRIFSQPVWVYEIDVHKPHAEK